MNTKYSITSMRKGNEVTHNYNGKVSTVISGNAHILSDVNSPGNLPLVLESMVPIHEECLKNSRLTKITTNFEVPVNNLSRFGNWLSLVWQDILVYTGPY